jgi:hypothetical protein
MTLRQTLVVALVAAGTAAQAQDGLNLPFLKQPANNRAAIVSQVSNDAQLRARYSKYFEASEEAVIASLEKAVMETLPPGTYTVWLTASNGLRYPTRQVRNRSTNTFRIPNPGGEGVALLEFGSGNPIQPFRQAIRIVDGPALPQAPQVVERTEEVLVEVGGGNGQESRETREETERRGRVIVTDE